MITATVLFKLQIFSTPTCVVTKCTKLHLSVSIMEESVDEELVAPDAYDFIVIDGGTLVHSLPGTAVHSKIFDAYFEKAFCPRVHHDLKQSVRVDIVWDQYHPLTIKGATREKRGPGNRQRISGSTKVTGHAHICGKHRKQERTVLLSVQKDHRRTVPG